MLASQFHKEAIVEYIANIEWERDHPDEAESLYTLNAHNIYIY